MQIKFLFHIAISIAISLIFTACNENKSVEITILSFSKIEKLSPELINAALPWAANDSCAADIFCDATLERLDNKVKQALFPEGGDWSSLSN